MAGPTELPFFDIGCRTGPFIANGPSYFIWIKIGETVGRSLAAKHELMKSR